MERRKPFSTALRHAVWEAHGRKCAYTGEPVDWSELEIDHVIPVSSDQSQIAELRARGVIEANFDINSFENLLPTKSHRNSQKSSFIQNDRALIFFLSQAQKNREKAERIYASTGASDNALKSWLRLKAHAETNNATIEDVVGDLRYRTEGEASLRFPPEIEGEAIFHANSQYAAILMDKPFALGKGTITEVELRRDDGAVVVCRTTNEYLAAKDGGLRPYSQLDITRSSVANQTSEFASRKGCQICRLFGDSSAANNIDES